MATPRENSDGVDEEPAPEGVIGLAGDTFRAARHLVGEASELAALEARLAAITAVRILATGLVVAVIAVSAWVLAQVALAIWLIGAGASLPPILAGLALLNVMICVWLALSAQRLSRRLTFPATRRMLLKRKADGEPAEGDSSPGASSHDRSADASAS